MRKLLAAFTDKQIQECHSLLKHLERNGKDVSEFMAYGAQLKNYLAAKDAVKAAIKKKLACPKCGKPLMIIPVNVNARTRIDEKFKCVISCSDWKNCGYERYSEKTIQEELRLLGREENGTR